MSFNVMERSARAGAARSDEEWLIDVRQEEEWLAEAREMVRMHREGGVRDGTTLYEIQSSSPPPAVQKRLAEHYGKMRAKYERASRYPWLRVPPDPPEPR